MSWTTCNICDPKIAAKRQLVVTMYDGCNVLLGNVVLLSLHPSVGSEMKFWSCKELWGCQCGKIQSVDRYEHAHINCTGEIHQRTADRSLFYIPRNICLVVDGDHTANCQMAWWMNCCLLHVRCDCTRPLLLVVSCNQSHSAVPRKYLHSVNQ